MCTSFEKFLTGQLHNVMYIIHVHTCTGTYRCMLLAFWSRNPYKSCHGYAPLQRLAQVQTHVSIVFVVDMGCIIIAPRHYHKYTHSPTHYTHYTMYKYTAGGFYVILRKEKYELVIHGLFREANILFKSPEGFL